MAEREVEAYLAKWYPRMERLRAIGFETYAFDPDLAVYPASQSDHTPPTVAFPIWVVEILECLAVRLYPETADDNAMIERRNERLEGGKP